MQKKQELLKELGWSDELIEAMVKDDPINIYNESITAETPIMLQNDTTKVIINITEPLFRSGSLSF